MTQEYKTQIIIAIIGLFGVFTTAFFSNYEKIFPPAEITLSPSAPEHIPNQPKSIDYSYAEGNLIQKINLNLNYDREANHSAELFILSNYISYYSQLKRCFDMYYSANLSDLDFQSAYIIENSRIKDNYHVRIPCKNTNKCVSVRHGSVRLPDCPEYNDIESEQLDQFAFNSRPKELATELQYLLKKLQIEIHKQ